MDAVIYVLQKTHGGKVVAVTHSAKKVRAMLQPGLRAELWVEGQKRAVYYYRTLDKVGEPISPGFIEYNAANKVDKARKQLTTQQYKTLKGQISAGRPEAALKGLQKIMERGRTKP